MLIHCVKSTVTILSIQPHLQGGFHRPPLGSLPGLRASRRRAGGGRGRRRWSGREAARAFLRPNVGLAVEKSDHGVIENITNYPSWVCQNKGKARPKSTGFTIISTMNMSNFGYPAFSDQPKCAEIMKNRWCNWQKTKNTTEREKGRDRNRKVKGKTLLKPYQLEHFWKNETKIVVSTHKFFRCSNLPDPQIISVTAMLKTFKTQHPP